MDYDTQPFCSMKCRKITPLCGEGEIWPITRPGAVQKPDAVTVYNKGEGCAQMTTVQDGPGAPCSCLPMSLHGLGMRRGRGQAERSRLARLVRTLWTIYDQAYQLVFCALSSAVR